MSSPSLNRRVTVDDGAHVLVTTQDGGPVPVAVVDTDYETARQIAKEYEGPVWVWGSAPLTDAGDEVSG